MHILPEITAAKSPSPSPATPPPARDLDRWAHAQLAPLTGGISIAALRMAFDDWLVHLSHNPAQLGELAQECAQLALQLPSYAPSTGTSASALESRLVDRRFADPGWQAWPFNFYSQSFLLTQKWWHDATTGVRGVSKHHEDVVSFTVRQLLDMVSPANFIWSNPAVLERTTKTAGANLRQGFQNFVEDTQRLKAQQPPVGTDAFVVGRDVAITPGKVIFRNHLIELIQYRAVGAKVHAEPILMVPAWIMKYYILDMSPNNSLIKYLVDAGYKVFAISWINPDATDRELGMDNYLQEGVMAAVDAVAAIVPAKKMHGVGYCLGGTLLS
ncbi:MAG: poly-beta-hydroxybutyrate polymerase N-terminal domain-containing protein, partial [Usitatibacteraceae bacterium]